MAEDDVFEALTDACIAAGEAVMTHGTPEMRDAMRALLYCLAREIARREAVTSVAPHDILLSDRAMP